MKVFSSAILLVLWSTALAAPKVRRRRQLQQAHVLPGDDPAAAFVSQRHLGSTRRRGGNGDDDDDDDGGSYNSAPSPAVGTQVTIAQLLTHNTAGSCWIKVNNNAYDVTSFASRHPGGTGVLYAMCGLDATATFYGIGKHSTSDLSRAINMGTIGAGAPVPTPTGAPPTTPNVGTGGLTMTQVSSHNSANDCWLVVSGNAYDVTSFASSHPGGTAVLYATCGRDATSSFNAIGKHSMSDLSRAINKGPIVASIPIPSPTSAPAPTPTVTSTGGLTMAQISLHNSASDCWVVESGNAYDVTSYASIHPGGPAAIQAQCGKDITTRFSAAGAFHTRAALGGAKFMGAVGGGGSVPAPSPTSAPPPTPTSVTGGLTMAQVASHNSASDCWLVVNGNAYDVTSFASRHPGGTSVLYAACGLDATYWFNSEKEHSTSDLRRAVYMGTVTTGAPAPSPTPPTTPTTTNNNVSSGGLTMAQVSTHKSSGDCWIKVNNNAYDVTSFASRHPGGTGVLYAMCGLDATSAFYSIGKHSTSDLSRAINKGTIVG